MLRHYQGSNLGFRKTRFIKILSDNPYTIVPYLAFKNTFNYVYIS